MLRYSIVGAITNATEEEKDLFNIAEEKLRKLGHEVFNPLSLEERFPRYTWEDYMEMCLQELIQNRNILVLPTAHKSRGAMLEIQTAQALKYNIEGYDAL